MLELSKPSAIPLGVHKVVVEPFRQIRRLIFEDAHDDEARGGGAPFSAFWRRCGRRARFSVARNGEERGED